MKKGEIAVFLTLVFVVFLFPLRVKNVNAQIMDYTPLKALPSEILDHEIVQEQYLDEKTQTLNQTEPFIKYYYISDKLADIEPNEERKTETSIIYNINEKTKRARIFPQPTFYFEPALDTWLLIENATTTIDNFNTMTISHNPVKQFFGIPALAQIYAGTSDGTIACNSSYQATWSTCRDTNNGGTPATSGTTPQTILASTNASNQYMVYREFQTYDTSIITDSYQVDSASIYLYKHVDDDNHDGQFGAVASTHSDTLASTDFDNITYTWLTNLNWTDSSAVGWLQFDYYSTTTDTINKTGNTKIAFLNEHDFSNTPPSTSQYSRITIRSADYTGTSSDPYMDITYSLIPVATSTLEIGYPDDLPEVNDLAVITGKIENDDGSYSYVYYRIPFLIWAILYLIVFWIAERIVLELIIRWRK